jgi:hypothetical protein
MASVWAKSTPATDGTPATALSGNRKKSRANVAGLLEGRAAITTGGDRAAVAR